jgi:hypothetical protein
MVEAEKASEVLDFKSEKTRLVAGEDFVTGCDSLLKFSRLLVM